VTPDVAHHPHLVEDHKPSVTSSSSWGRKELIRSAVSTTMIASGRSSPRLSNRVVCTRDDAPNPSMPRKTLAPASPPACARCTISA
jgi:hypothetical protein